MSKIDKIKQRKIEKQDFYGKIFKPSDYVLKSLYKIFALIMQDFGKTFEIKNLKWTIDILSFDLVDFETGENFNLRLSKNTTCNFKFCLKDVCFGNHGYFNNKNFLKFLLLLKKRELQLTFDTFLNLLVNDPKAKMEYYNIFWKFSRPKYSIIQDWGEKIHNYKFLVLEGYLRNFDQSINLNLSEIYIHHSEIECQSIGPKIKNSYRFFNFSKDYYSENDYAYYYLSDDEKQNYNSKNCNYGLSTNLDEEDIIMGNGTNKLEKLIDHAIEISKIKDVKVFTFNCCCVPRVVGDDIYSVLNRAKNKMTIPFIFKGQLEKTPFDQKVELLESYINKFNNLEKIQNTISLFGYGENEYMRDLSIILADNGIKINSSFIPNIDVKLIPKMLSSQLFIFTKNHLQKEVFEYPFQDLNIDYLELYYPYGIKYTTLWLEKILKNFGIDYNLPQEIKIDIIDKFHNVKENILEKKYTVGIFLCDKIDVENFFMPGNLNNLKIYEILKEMGFIVKIFVYNSELDIKKITSSKNEISKVFYENNCEDFQFYNSFYELENELRILNLYYTDIVFDDRFIKYGINQINLKNFYPGYSGALKTITELTKLCEMDFFKKYNYYLK